MRMRLAEEWNRRTETMAEDADWRLTAQGFYADALYENGDFGRVRAQTVRAGGAGGRSTTLSFTAIATARHRYSLWSSTISTWLYLHKFDCATSTSVSSLSTRSSRFSRPSALTRKTSSCTTPRWLCLRCVCVLQAADIQRQVLAARKRALVILGLKEEHDQDTLTAQNDLANSLGRLGKYAEAAAIQQTLLANFKRTYGEDDLSTLTAVRIIFANSQSVIYSPFPLCFPQPLLAAAANNLPMVGSRRFETAAVGQRASPTPTFHRNFAFFPSWFRVENGMDADLEIGKRNIINGYCRHRTLQQRTTTCPISRRQWRYSVGDHHLCLV
jgi:hypothetical protein